MSGIGGKDARVQKTLKRIQAAFHDLVMSKNCDQLTVSALCQAAHVGRKTFYAHYSSLDELMERTLATMTKDYITRIQDLRVPEDTREITRQFYLYSEEQGVFYEKLICGESYQVHGGRLLKKFVAGTWSKSPWFHALAPAKQDILLCFIYSTGSALYRQWVEDGRKIPVEEMIDFANDLLSRGIEGLDSGLSLP